MKLSEFYPNLSENISNITLEGISADSRKIKPQYAFVAITGNNANGHDFIDNAIENGAVCIITDKKIDTEISVVTDEEIEKRGMGTTLTALLIRDKFISLLHVGDCHAIMGDGEITITILAVKGNQVRIGIQAPENTQVDREEVYLRKQRDGSRPLKTN